MKQLAIRFIEAFKKDYLFNINVVLLIIMAITLLVINN